MTYLGVAVKLIFKRPKLWRRKMRMMKKVFFVAIITVGCISLYAAGENVETTATPEKTMRDSAKIWYSVGKDYLLKKRYKDAVRNFKKALGYDSTYIEIYLDLARAYLGLGHMDSAEVAYRKVAEIDPKDSRGWQGLGFLYGILRKDVDKGVEYYKKALEVDPDNNDARFGLASLLDKAGRSAEADSVYLEAIKRAPENPGIKRAYGLFLESQGRYDEAVKYLKEVLPIFKDDKEVHEALMNAGIKSKKPELLEIALESVNYLISKDSSNYTYFLKRADIYERMGKYQKALADYDKAIELADGYTPIPYLKKANLLVDKLKDYVRARKVLREALKLEFPNDDLKAAAYDLLGDTYMTSAKIARKEGDDLRKRGLEQEARQKYKEAVENYDLAIKEYQKALSLNSPKWAEYARKQIERAKKVRQKAWRKSQGIE